MGLLLITHDMGVIAGRADKVLVMYAGRIMESADTGTLFSRVRHPYTQALLESIPDLETDRKKILYSIPGRPPDLARPPSCCRFSPRCRYAQEQCRNEDPPLGGHEPGHSYACFFPVDGPRARGLAAAEDIESWARPQAVPGQVTAMAPSAPSSATVIRLTARLTSLLPGACWSSTMWLRSSRSSGACSSARSAQ